MRNLINEIVYDYLINKIVHDYLINVVYDYLLMIIK